MLVDLVRRLPGDLTRPLPSAHVVDREQTRSTLVLASSLIVATTLALPQPGAVHAPVAWAMVGVVAVTWLASRSERIQPVLNRVGGILLAAEIALTVAATGGAESPYQVLYFMLLLYATIFYDTRRLLVTAVVLALAGGAPYLSPSVTDGQRVELLTTVSVWLVTSFVIHGLVTELRSRARQMSEQEQRYRSLVDHNPDGVYSLDGDGLLTELNAAALEILGYERDDLVGQSFLPLVAPDDIDEAVQRFDQSKLGTPKGYELSVVRSDGRHVPVALTTVPIFVDGEIVGVHGIAKDISERVALQESLAFQALHDPLTGLANRTLFDDRLAHAIAATTRDGGRTALLVLDLDGFKPVNDSLGHAAGDRILVEIGRRMTACVRATDTVARLGGDEFAVVLPGAGRARASEVAERIIESVGMPYALDDHRVDLSASIGITTGGGGSDPVALVREADRAMFAAKHAGRGGVASYDADHHAEGSGARCLVEVSGARSWARYMRTFRSEIAARKETGELAMQLGAPTTVHRTLQELLASIDELPGDRAHGDLALPERRQLEELFFHQTAVHHWADSLVRAGTLTTVRADDAEEFWATLGTHVAGRDPGAACAAPGLIA